MEGERVSTSKLAQKGQRCFFFFFEVLSVVLSAGAAWLEAALALLLPLPLLVLLEDDAGLSEDVEAAAASFTGAGAAALLAAGAAAEPAAGARSLWKSEAASGFSLVVPGGAFRGVVPAGEG